MAGALEKMINSSRNELVGNLLVVITLFVAVSGQVKGQGLGFSRADTAFGVGAVMVQDEEGVWPGMSLTVVLNGAVNVETMLNRTSSSSAGPFEADLMGRRLGIRASGDVVRQTTSFPLTLGFSVDLARSRYDRTWVTRTRAWSKRASSRSLSGRIHREVGVSDAVTVSVFIEPGLHIRLVEDIRDHGTPWTGYIAKHARQVLRSRQINRFLHVGGTASIAIRGRWNLVVHPAFRFGDPDVIFTMRTAIFWVM